MLWAYRRFAGVFKEYLEMWMQFGMVTLFACTFPLAALFALINNLIEIRTDAFTLVRSCRRPMPLRVAGLGSWVGPHIRHALLSRTPPFKSQTLCRHAFPESYARYKSRKFKTCFAKFGARELIVDTFLRALFRSGASRF